MKQIKSLVFRSVALLSFLYLAGCAAGSANNPAPATAGPEKPDATPDHTCSKVTLTHAKENLEYCFADSAGQATSSAAQVTVLYYFHGLGGTVKDIFEGSARQMYDQFISYVGVRAPIVVSLSIGSTGILGDDTAEILNTGLPKIEAIVAKGKSVRRVLLGVSMGGHNSLRLGAEGGSSTFVAVVALCPAIATFNAYHASELDAYKKRNAAVLDVNLFNYAITVFKQKATSEASWDANNPFTFLTRGAYDGLAMFMSVGTEDTLAFFEGTREFVRRGASRPSPLSVEYHEVSGGHCSFDPAATLNFLSAAI